MRDRSVVIVLRNNKILIEKICFEERSFYSVPGGGIENGETPEEAALRELKEECNLNGTIKKKLAEVHNNGRIEYSFEVSAPDDEEAVVGYNPEEDENEQSIKEVRWMELSELSEKDRAFLWGYGLLQVDGFFDEVKTWGDEISFPNENKTEFNSLIPELSVSDIDKAREFYVDILGFEICYERKENKFMFVQYEGNQIMLEQINDNWNTGDMEYPFGRGINFEMTVSDVEEIYKRVLDNGIKPFVELESETYKCGEEDVTQKQFLVQDPDGYLLRFTD